jgi:hypothetical protein
VADLVLTVEVAGVVAAPDGTGKYVVRPGQSVVVTSSEAAAWVGNDAGSGVTRTEVESGVSRWASRFDNPGALAPGAYQLTANTSAGRSKTVDFSVLTGNYANGEYMVFGTNGSRQTLNIDFDAATYSMTDAAGVTTTGALTAPVAPARDWAVQSSRIVGVNTASLRSVRDSIVGGFPFAVPHAAVGNYAVYPFVASRAFVRQQSELDGVYDRASIQHLVAGGGQSSISQMAISAGGTVLNQCVAAAINRVATCPPGSLSTSHIEADAATGLWLLKNPVTGASQGRFAIVEIDGEKMYLSAGTSVMDGSQVFTTGVLTRPGATVFTSSGWSTDGTLDVSNASATKYEMSKTAGGTTLLDLSMLSVGPLDSIGIYPATEAPDTYFAMRSQRIELLIGARSSARAGFLHLGIVD